MNEKNNAFSKSIEKIFSEIIHQVGETYCPFLLISDKLPEHQLIQNKLLQILKSNNSIKDVFLVVRDLQNENIETQFSILQIGIRDVYYWNGEEDFKDFILSTIQRRQKIVKILGSQLVRENLIGECFVWKDFISKIIEATLFSQCSLLLTGESGTGKELISRLIHTIDTRQAKQDLVVLDCTTIVPELSGSEFFGHERGSYTNAMQTREGAFALANNGTLFLDEIGDLPLSLQAGLLRVIQEGTYKKVGGNNWQKTNFRLICATHRNLKKQVEEHNFRQDLYYRISDFEFKVPTLNDRREDIPVLAGYFLKQFSKGDNAVELDDTILDFLKHREYPGNVRELRQLIQRICLKHVRHKKITLGEIPIEERNNFDCSKNGFDSFHSIVKQMIIQGENYNSIKEKINHSVFEAAIEISGGNKQKAAERLGIDVRTVQMGVKKKG